MTSSAAANASSTQVSYTAAGRILNQATFGPTMGDISLVQSIGIANYVKYQLSIPAYQMPVQIPSSYYNAGDCFGWICGPHYWWWTDILFGQDQLRQRVAYALGKLFVVSVTDVDARYFPYYLNVLSNDAFGNWQTLMHDVSLSSAMGQYLNSANSLYTGTGEHADENFAREMMQLMSIGTMALNNDGTPQLDANGNTIPNYTPAQVQDLARAFTGWTLAANNCAVPSQPLYFQWAWPWGEACPMVAMPQFHDSGQKTLLRGTVLQAGQTPQQDWDAAIANIFNDPSLPPFVCQRLIQNLVKSNPSPAYVNRVANVFINDGTGTRGNLAAVITAILLDNEARADDAGGTPADPNTGLMRDPLLWYSSVLRAVQAQQTMPYPWVNIYPGRFDKMLESMGEETHAAPSVFSFYSPMNTINAGGTTLLAPEFQLENSQSVNAMMVHAQDTVNGNYNMPQAQINEFTVDLSATSPLGVMTQMYGIDELLYILNQLMLHGTMTPQMEQTIKAGVIHETDVGSIVRDAVYMIVTSPQYRIMI